MRSTALPEAGACGILTPAMTFRTIALFIVLGLPCRVFGLGPHEILLLANADSVDSVRVAKEYARLRGVPEQNLVRLSMPRELGRAAAALKPADFTRLIWLPANRQARRRGIEDHILAWVYSVDFPVRIAVKPEISIQRLTFLRNRLPDPDEVEKGTYASPLFAGPLNIAGKAHESQTLDVLRLWLRNEMPLPSMMLGVSGPRGNTVEEILECLRRGAASDGGMPEATVYFGKGRDIRSTCREWQYGTARRELFRLGVRSAVAATPPRDADDIIGIFMGAANVIPPRGRYLPGCIAEHLTSASAVFHSDHQTKLTAWIKTGATASAGAVTEPYSNWKKFPCAHVYVHYARGCTVLESFFQAIRCPLQILLVGEPLAAPWGPKAEVSIGGLGTDPLAGTVALTAEVSATNPVELYGRIVWLVDGRPAAEGRRFEWDTAGAPNGVHRVRAVACRTGFIRSQAFRELEIEVRNGGE